MANQRRSIWEIRFFALCERMQSKRTMLKHKAGRLALKDGLSSTDRENLKNRIDILDQLISDSEDIGRQRSQNIFLMRDV